MKYRNGCLKNNQCDNLPAELLSFLDSNRLLHQTAFGVPAKEIIEAGSAYKVVVVTDEGRSRIQRIFKGSTALDVVRQARTSVLDVR